MTKIFNLLLVFLINTLLFVRIEDRSPEAAIQMYSLMKGGHREK